MGNYLTRQVATLRREEGGHMAIAVVCHVAGYSRPDWVTCVSWKEALRAYLKKKAHIK